MRRSCGRFEVSIAPLTSAMVTFGLAGSACAQSASIVVTHNDSDGVVSPGQTVRITCHLSWTEWTYLGAMLGDAVTSPNLGLAASPVTAFNHGFLNAAIYPGTPEGGSIRGFVAFETLAAFSLHTPGFEWAAGGIDALSFDWTAPGPEAAGTYAFTFEGAAGPGAIQLFPPSALQPVPVPTTVTPASLIVTPAPASVLLLGSLAARTSRRVRRT